MSDPLHQRGRLVKVSGALLLVLLSIVFASCSEGASREAPIGRFTGTTGAELYLQACATCHGEDLQGTDQGPPFLDRIYEPSHHPDAAFLAAAMMGVRAHHWDFGSMPRIEGITEVQVLAIAAYVRERQRAVGIE